MNDKPLPPSRFRIASNDSMLGVLALGLIIPLFFIVVLPFQIDPELQGGDFWGFMIVMLIVALASLATMIWRARKRIRNIYDKWDQGIVDVARIRTVETVKYGRARVREMVYVYEYDGELYEKRSMATHRQYKVGTQLDILIDPQKPDDPLVISDYVK